MIDSQIDEALLKNYADELQYWWLQPATKRVEKRSLDDTPNNMTATREFAAAAQFFLQQAESELNQNYPGAYE